MDADRLFTRPSGCTPLNLVARGGGLLFLSPGYACDREGPCRNENKSIWEKVGALSRNYDAASRDPQGDDKREYPRARSPNAKQEVPQAEPNGKQRAVNIRKRAMDAWAMALQVAPTTTRQENAPWTHGRQGPAWSRRLQQHMTRTE